MTDTMIEVPELPELTFEDSTHTYRLNGIVIPSVSTLMEPLTAAKYKGISEATLDRAADKGTSVHNAIENYIKFGMCHVEVMKVSDYIDIHCQTCCRFVEVPEDFEV